jgi:hypothetical protein
MLAELTIGIRSHFAPVALLLTLAFMVAGCGSGTQTEDSVASTVPKARFMKKVLAICAQANEEISRVYGQYAQPPYPGGKRPTSEKMNEVAEEVVIPARAKQVRRIRALGFPPGEERQVEAILLAIEEGIEEGKRDRRTLRADGVRYAFTKALRLESEFGIEECGLG